VSEKDDLDNLLKSPGWLMLKDYARKEWRENYPAKVKMAIQHAKGDNLSLSAAVEAVDAASDAINALLSWPQERLQRLAQIVEAEHAVTGPSRRGTL
jgi:hypothetical protein